MKCISCRLSVVDSYQDVGFGEIFLRCFSVSRFTGCFQKYLWGVFDE